MRWGASIRIPSIPPDWTFEHYALHRPWRKHMFNFLGPLEGKTILDLGCGYNPTPVYLALAGAKKVIACDVSPRAIDFVLSMSRQYSLQHQIIPHLEPADSLSLEDSSIDLIHGEAVLHHLDLNRAGTQLSRVLKKGGRAVFKDPLGHNFLLELARDYLPYPWKHPIKGTDRPLRFPAIKQFGQYFSYSDARGFGLFSMIAIILFGRGRSRSQSIAHGIEERVLRAIPWLQRACRFVVTRVEK